MTRKDTEKDELLRLFTEREISVRAWNIIFNNISSIKELANLTYPKLMSFRNCGMKTASEIMASVNELRENVPSLMDSEQLSCRSNHVPHIQLHWLTPEQKAKKTLALPPATEGLNLLPFFSSRRLPFLSEGDLHPGYQVDTRLTDILMPLRTVKVLEQIGLERLGQVLLTPRFEFLQHKNFGRKTLRNLYGAVTHFLLVETRQNTSRQFYYSSFPEMVRGMVADCRLKQRDQEIVFMWLSPAGNIRVTQKAIAEKYGLSKGRIWQIINRASRQLRHPARAKKLIPFWSRVVGITKSQERSINLEDLAEAIAGEFKWDEAPDPESIERLIRECGPEELIERLGITKTRGDRTSFISRLCKDYYEINAEAYHASTVRIDPASFLTPLARRLTPGAAILDLGCGSGRDMRWFEERGFRVTGMERSASLAGMARNHCKCPVIEADFETYDFSSMCFDALVLIGAMVHIPQNRFRHILENMLQALVSGGYVLITLKEGQHLTETSFPRVFYLWQDSDLRTIFRDLGLKVVDFSRSVSKVRDSDIWLGYVLQNVIRYSRCS